MSALKQYIDLYREHKALFDNGSAPVINAWRDDALKTLLNTALPHKGSENYEHFSLADALAPDYGLNPARVPIDVDPAASFRCDVPNLSTALFINLNDRMAKSQLTDRSLPEGVVAGSLRECARSHPGRGD